MRNRFTSLTYQNNRRDFLIVAGMTMAAGLVAISLPAGAQETSPGNFEVMDAQSAFEAAQSGEIVLVDIRRPDEWNETGIGKGAVALDMREESFVASLVELRQKYPKKPIALICRTGNRSGNVVSVLAAQNFPGLVDVSEGMVGGRNGPGWLARGLPIYAGTQAEIQPRLAAILDR